MNICLITLSSFFQYFAYYLLQATAFKHYDLGNNGLERRIISVPIIINNFKDFGQARDLNLQLKGFYFCILLAEQKTGQESFHACNRKLLAILNSLSGFRMLE